MISKKLVFGLILLVALGLAIGTYSVGTNHSKNKNQSTKKVKASSSQAILTSQEDWNVGTKNNITVSGGSIEMDSKSGGGFGSEIPINSSQIQTDLTNKDNLVDSDLSTYLTFPGDGSDHTIRISLGSSVKFYIKIWTNAPDFAHNNVHVYTDDTYPGGGQFSLAESISCDSGYSCVNNDFSYQSFDHVLIRAGSWDTSFNIYQIKVYQAPTETEISLAGKSISADPDANKENVRDGSLSTGWGPGAHNWTVDLGQTTSLYTRLFVAVNFAIFSGGLQYSDNGSDYTNFSSGFVYNNPAEYKTNNVSARYVRIIQTSPYPHQYMELKLFDPIGATATHTSGSTQLNGGTDFYEWQTFTPTYTKPANTNVQYRFRSSTNSTDWTSWTDYQTPSSGSPLDITSLVTSRTGPTDSPTFYKYLQIETKLTSTDGVSTPTLSDYSIGYHINRPPDKPVAGTVIIGN